MSTSNTDAPTGASLPTFTTDVLALSAWLTARGHQATVSLSGKRVLFEFVRSTAFDVDLSSYNNGEALTDPVAYDAARVSLRRRMNALLRGGAR